MFSREVIADQIYQELEFSGLIFPGQVSENRNFDIATGVIDAMNLPLKQLGYMGVGDGYEMIEVRQEYHAVIVDAAISCGLRPNNCLATAIRMLCARMCFTDAPSDTDLIIDFKKSYAYHAQKNIDPNVDIELGLNYGNQVAVEVYDEWLQRNNLIGTFVSVRFDIHEVSFRDIGSRRCSASRVPGYMVLTGWNVSSGHYEWIASF